MNDRVFAVALSATAFCCSVSVLADTIQEIGDLNVINMPGNPSDGLRYLDMSYSDGKSLAAALANAQGTYPNARLATPAEFDDLFSAAGISYSGTLTAADGFETGDTVALVTYFGVPNPVRSLRDALGVTDGGVLSGSTYIFTDPDGLGGTRDYLQLSGSSSHIAQASQTPPNSAYGWLLVSEAAEVPAPSSVVGLIGLGLMGSVVACVRKWRAAK